MPSFRHSQICCRRMVFGHRLHLTRRGDRIAGLDQQRGGPHRQPLRPVSPGYPIPRRSRSSATCNRAAANRFRCGRKPPGNTARRRDRTHRILAQQSRIRPEEHAAKAPTGRSCGRESLAPCPRAPARKPVPDAGRPDTTSAGRPSNARPVLTGASNVRTASARSATNRSVLIGMRIVDVTAPVPQRVVTVDGAQPGQPR